MMTVKEAILKSLEDFAKPVTSPEVCKHIQLKEYCNFDNTAQPERTVAAEMGNFSRKGDSRVKRIKVNGKTFRYYLTINEPNIAEEHLSNEPEITSTRIPRNNTNRTYEERDLHKILSSYLKSSGIYSKTIFHEQSNGKDNNQIWTHPDMVGIKFLNLQSKASQNFLKSINRVDTFKIYSYEIKKEINSDSELKKAFFQAVSNSSWANFGYLTAFEFSDSLTEEMERLNQSFGIGVILLNSNPYQSKILFPAKYRDLDFKTIDKLCKINKEFEKFIEHIENLMTIDERNISSVEREFNEFCDDYFTNDTEVEKYCEEKHIPID